MHKIRDDDAVAFAARLLASGLSTKEMETVLLVGQSTVSRLLHARIRAVRRHVAAFDRWERAGDANGDLDLAMADLAAAGRHDPRIRRLLIDLSDVMRRA